MARYKGAITPQQNERNFPHLVELMVPAGGFRRTLDDMEAFHIGRRIPMKSGKGRNDGGAFYVRWCFADPADADAFRDRFGGKRLAAGGG